MSALTINKVDELPVWTVHGYNWEVDIPLDEVTNSVEDVTYEIVNKESKQKTIWHINAQQMKAYEAATKAMSAFQGRDNGVFLKLNENEESPKVGTVLIVHLKDTDPNLGFLIPTHECLANDGYYKEANKLAVLFNKQRESILQEQAAKNKQLKEALIEEIQRMSIEQRQAAKTPKKKTSKAKKPKRNKDE